MLFRPECLVIAINQAFSRNIISKLCILMFIKKWCHVQINVIAYNLNCESKDPKTEWLVSVKAIYQQIALTSIFCLHYIRMRYLDNIVCLPISSCIIGLF